MEYKLVFSEEEVNTILNSLSQLPYKDSVGIINKIFAQSKAAQIVEQTAAATTTTSEDSTSSQEEKK